MRNLSPVLYFALGCAGVAALLGLALWGPMEAVLHEGHRAEINRLMDAFEQPLEDAIAKGDDLAQIDQLHRLQKLPGVISARIESGHLKIQVSRTRWQRLRYVCLERLWTLGVCMAVLGGIFGWIVQRRRRDHLARLKQLLLRQQNRRRAAMTGQHTALDRQYRAWMSEAADFNPGGLVLLDSQQTVALCNAKARDLLGFTADTAGKHWLDIQPSEAWASALRRSAELPGFPVEGPSEGPVKTSLITRLKDSDIIDTTWIVLH
jgi:PAS domain-containing protein